MTIQFVPSATILARLRLETPVSDLGSRSAAVLAVAGPGEGGPPLPGAAAEVREISTVYRGVVIELARVGAVPHSLASFSGYDVIHLAAHAVIEPERPWSSRILLGRSPDSLALTASSIADSRLEASLVVLSTCRSAAGRVAPGEGVLGPASAFLAAGVPSVVAAQWSVDDDCAREMMRTFYAGLAEGATVAEALAGAQARLRATHRFRDPFYWSPWIVVGDGHRRLPLVPKSAVERLDFRFALIAAGGLLLSGGLLATWRRRRPREVSSAAEELICDSATTRSFMT